MEDAKPSAAAKLLAATTMEHRAESLYLALWQADPLDPTTFEKLTKLRAAIGDQVYVTFDYLDLQNIHTSRRAKPVALDRRGSSLHLVAWCALRRDFYPARPKNIFQP